MINTFVCDGLEELLREVELGNISTMITKDLTELERNYLKFRQLTDIFFPKHNVRYIAISDGVDSLKGDNEIDLFSALFFCGDCGYSNSNHDFFL